MLKMYAIIARTGENKSVVNYYDTLKDAQDDIDRVSMGELKEIAVYERKQLVDPSGATPEELTDENMI